LSDITNKGEVTSTKNRMPLKLIYFEACLSQVDAPKREKYLKTYYDATFIKKQASKLLSITQLVIHLGARTFKL
jgi:putative endonuclease